MMKRLFELIAVAVLFCGAAFGQGPYIGPGVKATAFLQATSAPSGSCTANSVAWFGGNYYGCISGTWAQFSAGSSGTGVTTTGLTSGIIPKATASSTVGNSALDDGKTAANTLTYSGSGGLSVGQIKFPFSDGVMQGVSFDGDGLLLSKWSQNIAFLGSSVAGSFLNLSTSSMLGWSPNVNILTSPDVALSRAGAGVVVVGNGTAGDQSGRLGAGSLTVKPVIFSALAACASGIEGTTAAVTDSTTATWGATIAGSGTNHVLAYCDGAAWTVAAK